LLKTERRTQNVEFGLPVDDIAGGIVASRAVVVAVVAAAVAAAAIAVVVAVAVAVVAACTCDFVERLTVVVVSPSAVSAHY
jgi:hypothetical protein